MFAPLRRMSLSVRLAILMGLLTAGVVAATFVAASLATRSHARDILAEELAAHQRALLALQQQTLQQVLVTSQLVGDSPALRAALATYREESSARRVPRAELLATIRSSLRPLAMELPHDLLVVTDETGTVLWAADRGGVAPGAGTDLSRLPAVRTALDSADASRESSFAIVRLGGTVFQLGCVPVIQAGFPIGTLLLGDRLDSAAVGRLKSILGSEVVVRVESEALVASLPVPDARALAEVTGRTVRLRDENYVIASVPIGLDDAGRRVMLDLLRPLAETTAALQGALTRSFLLYGLLAIAAASVAAGLGARSVLLSFRDFVRFMGAVAKSGDYSRRFVDPRPTPELRTLTEGYTQLITSLSQSHLERERAERALRERDEQLRQSQKLEAIGRLAGGVAHDFNNLLTVIHSYTELLMAGVDKEHAMHADLEQIRQAAARAGRLTGQLLAFSRKQVMQPRVLDLAVVVGGVEKMLRRLIGEHIDFSTTADEALPPVKADPGQLEQVIVNLVVNARDAMPQGGRLRIATGLLQLREPDPSTHGPTPPGTWVTLTVTDTGFGMEAATMQRIFEPFFTTKGLGRGTGLGLAMVYGIVSQSGGFIHVHSQPAKGTSFCIYLPAIYEAIPGVTESPESMEADLSGSETVLLVEDEEMVRSLAEKTLRKHGYTVLSASNGTAALELAERYADPIHLLLTDVVMPHMSGKELARAVVRRHPGIRVLYMSGYTEDTIVHQGLLENGVLLLQKPFTPSIMARRIREILDIHIPEANALA